jgi:nicotinamidase-related amidase
MSKTLVIIDVQEGYDDSWYLRTWYQRGNRKITNTKPVEQLGNVLNLIKIFKKNKWNIVSVNFEEMCESIPPIKKLAWTYKNHHELRKDDCDGGKLLYRFFEINNLLNEEEYVFCGCYGDDCVKKTAETFYEITDCNVSIIKDCVVCFGSKIPKYTKGISMKDSFIP